MVTFFVTMSPPDSAARPRSNLCAVFFSIDSLRLRWMARTKATTSPQAIRSVVPASERTTSAPPSSAKERTWTIDDA